MQVLSRIAVISYAGVGKLFLFLNLSCLTNSTSEVVELSATNLTYAIYFNLLNVRRMDRESLLNAYAVGNSSNREGLGDSAAVLSDNGTVEHLCSGLLSLSDADVNLYAILTLPGSSVHGILKARVLEWVAMPSSRGSSLARD